MQTLWFQFTTGVLSFNTGANSSLSKISSDMNGILYNKILEILKPVFGSKTRAHLYTPSVHTIIRSYHFVKLGNENLNSLQIDISNECLHFSQFLFSFTFPLSNFTAKCECWHCNNKRRRYINEVQSIKGPRNRLAIKCRVKNTNLIMNSTFFFAQSKNKSIFF